MASSGEEDEDAVDAEIEQEFWAEIVEEAKMQKKRKFTKESAEIDAELWAEIEREAEKKRDRAGGLEEAQVLELRRAG